MTHRCIKLLVTPALALFLAPLCTDAQMPAQVSPADLRVGGPSPPESHVADWPAYGHDP
jgi:hypothetical protein